MLNATEWYDNLLLSKTKKALENNGFLVKVFVSGDDCLKYFISRIDKKQPIGMGGSTTVKEIGLFDYIIKNNYNFINPYIPNLTKEEIIELRRKTLFSYYYITGCNAVTEEGELVNIDGFSNRVAAIMFGPKKVFLFVGKNKIVKTRDDAIRRIREYAAPINAKRLNRNTPCVESGQCEDCDSEDRICNNLVICMKQNIKDRIEIFLINEELGF